jgi:hypothetical protein
MNDYESEPFFCPTCGSHEYEPGKQCPNQKNHGLRKEPPIRIIVGKINPGAYNSTTIMLEAKKRFKDQKKSSSATDPFCSLGVKASKPKYLANRSLGMRERIGHSKNRRKPQLNNRLNNINNVRSGTELLKVEGAAEMVKIAFNKAKSYGLQPRYVRFSCSNSKVLWLAIVEASISNKQVLLDDGWVM